jgi:hypothetical protein
MTPKPQSFWVCCTYMFAIIFNTKVCTHLQHTTCNVLFMYTGSLTASVSYNHTSHTLTCVSSGGPVNTITWTRNGADITPSSYQIHQSLVDGITSTYHNLLTVASNDTEDYVGSFSCTASNSRGSSPSQVLRINGILCFYFS